MPQPPRPPELREMQRMKHWPQLEPIFQTGRDDARRGHWDNDQPPRTLRWYAYEAGWDVGESENQN
jgi:hypothetical protein